MLIRLFGRVSIGGRPVTAQKHACMLAVLAVRPGEPVSSSDLIDRIWDGDPPTTALSVLYSQVARVRSWLRDHTAEIRRAGGGYVLDVDHDEIDLHRARGLAALADHDIRAVHLWREATALVGGEALAGVKGRWAEDIREAMHRERTGWRAAWFTAELAAGNHAAVIDELAAAVQAEPLAESVAAAYMVALYRCGRPADALVVFDDLRHRLRDELGADPATELRELHRRILDHDPSLATPSPPAPMPIPAAIGTFSGRDRELSILDKLRAEEPGQGLVVLVGQAGVGKTTLAVRWAHRARDRFPDGQLFVNLHGFDPGGHAMEPGQALRSLLELLRVPPQQIPSTLEAQAGMYRGRLAGARMLVVLDNARDADQVRPLLPGSSESMVVVTSRDQLTGLVTEGAAHRIRLDGLDDSEARQLLTGRLGQQRVDAEPDAVRQIITACAGLPLALAIVAARAVTCPGFPLSAFAAELTDARGRLDALAGTDPATDIRAVFSWSYQALRVPAARLFRLLSLHPGPHVSVAAAASLAGVPPAQARRLIAELTGAHLLTEDAPGRYSFHDLVWAYARELTDSTDDPAERESALIRMFDHYVHSGHRAAALINPNRIPIEPAPARPGTTVDGFSSATDANAWFHRERETLLATVHLAGIGAHHTHCWQLTWSIADYLERRGRWPDALTSHHAALDAARRHGDSAMRARSHHSLGINYTRLGRYPQAYEHLQAALDLHTTLGSPNGLMRVHLGFALAYDGQGRHVDALRHNRLALTMAQTAGDDAGQVGCLNGIGWQHAQLGDYRQCIAYCEQALAVPSEHDHRFHASTWDTLGYAYHHLAQYDQAIAGYRRAIALFRELGIRLHEARSLARLADSHDALGEVAEARQARRHALEIFEELGHPDGEPIRAKLA